jgi:hypothetical protein
VDGTDNQSAGLFVCLFVCLITCGFFTHCENVIILLLRYLTSEHFFFYYHIFLIGDFGINSCFCRYENHSFLCCTVHAYHCYAQNLLISSNGILYVPNHKIHVFKG